MEEFIIPQQIVALLQEADWVCLATRDSNGEPNAANKFIVRCEPDTVYFADFEKGTTWENIRNHRYVAFPIMDTDNLIDYQLSGEADIIENGDMYAQLQKDLTSQELRFSTKRVIEGIRRERSHGTFDFPKIENATFIRVKISDIVVRGPSVKKDTF